MDLTDPCGTPYTTFFEVDVLRLMNNWQHF